MKIRHTMSMMEMYMCMCRMCMPLCANLRCA